MKKQWNTNFIICSILSLALALAIWSPVTSQTSGTAEEKMMKSCREMMEKKEKMMAEMKVRNDDLTAEIATMNSAPNDKKLDLLAAVVTHMDQHRTSMHEKKDKMHEEMMGHMMEHMQMGQGTMSHCPMMKGMKGMGGK